MPQGLRENVESSWKQHHGTLCVGVNWDLYDDGVMAAVSVLREFVDWWNTREVKLFFIIRNLLSLISQPAIACSMLTVETLGQCKKYVQS